MADLAVQSIDMLENLKQDIPQAEYDVWTHTLQAMRDGFIQLTKERGYQRLQKKGSEKIGQPAKELSIEEKITNAKNAVVIAERALKRKTKQLNDTVAVAKTAAKAKGQAEIWRSCVPLCHGRETQFCYSFILNFMTKL